MNSNTNNNAYKRVLGAKNASTLDVVPQQNTINKLDKENVTAGDLLVSPKAKASLSEEKRFNHTSFKYKTSSFHQDQDQVYPRFGGNANPEAGPSKPKSRKRKELVDEYAGTQVAKRPRTSGPRVISKSPSKGADTLESAVYLEEDTFQHVCETFLGNPCVVDSDDSIKEPAKAASHEGNGTKQTFKSGLPDIRDDSSDALATIAAKTNTGYEVLKAGNGSTFLGNFSEGVFGTIGEDLGEYRVPSYSFEPFLGVGFSPFAQVSFGSEAQPDVEDVLAGWSTPLGVCEERQPSAAPSDIGPGMFLAPEAEAQEESTGPEAEAAEELVALEPEARKESAEPEAEDQGEPEAPEAEGQEELVVDCNRG
ncbi:hypothetical protein M408DRAFT_23105 [Serendipita vermifera MAFF 305830]|uniref:Uncharacterized protein n=1 Tax=Serendipita vermifera MAFF 305830 TaxID=933852 RepID=A0A0C3BD10_SERVB|nr:hypothetical protein M408DRAFT_23105 [Serendipita vermifera MAFF 305830]